jgi:Divergent InlB B-repeat domain
VKSILILLICGFLFILSCEKEKFYTLNISVTPSGSGTTSITSGTYKEGQTISITATPGSEYTFKGWTGSINSTANPLTIIMDSIKNITAEFEKRQYPLNLTIEGSGTVKEEIVLTQSKVGSYPSGTSVKLTAVPNAAWRFDSWSGDTTVTANPIILNFKKGYSLKAKFLPIILDSIKITKRIDTLVISNSFKYTVIGYFNDKSTKDLSDSVSISSDNSNITIKNRTIIGAKSGISKINMNYKSFSLIDSIYINYFEDVKELDSYLKTPINGSKIKVPVIIINYIPTNDGINKDVSKAPGYFSLQKRTVDEVKISLNNLSKGIKFSAEEGSKFRGFNDKAAIPYAGIEVIKQFNFYEMSLIPATFKDKAAYTLEPMHEPDYKDIFNKIGLKSLVENFGVKEIWFNVSHLYKGLPSYDINVHNSKDFVVLPESNMSSPTGDISNSYRNTNDLPVYNNTYVVYGFNYNGAFDIIDYIPTNIHVRSHQIEVQLNERDRSPKKELWNNMFVGIPTSGGKPKGRCGNVHYPPNATNDYDYNNLNFINSDIEDWKPDGTGKFKAINKLTWNSVGYIWPPGVFSDSQSNWLLYWYQSIPNLDNKLEYKGSQLTNWWDIFYNWDISVSNNLSLYK